MNKCKLASLAMAVTLAAGCHGTSSESSSRTLAQDDTDTPRPQYPFGLACGWELASNIDTMNAAFPDESAKYWVAMVPMLPGTRLRIDGRYPALRYFSLHVYDPILRPVDALADAQLLPDPGGRNPFAESGAAAGDRYTAYAEFTAPPAQRAANTLYAGQTSLGPQPVPQVLMTAVIYRSYVPADGLDFDGGVGLPLLTFETADGQTELLPTADCVEPLLPTLGDSLPQLGINDTLEATDLIDDPFLALGNALPVGDPRAESRVFYGLPGTALSLIRYFFGVPLPEGIEEPLPLPAGGGFLSNLHNAYATNLFSRNYGNVVLIRARAPSWRGEDGVAFGEEQMRYWSVCQNDLPSQRYVACVRDEQSHLDELGYFTIMVSDAADRPANAVPENHVDWMPWGPYFDALLVYRHMLPDPAFAQAIQNVPQYTPPGQIMGEYLPQSAYCTRDIVEAAGDSAAAIFQACRVYTENLQQLVAP